MANQRIIVCGDIHGANKALLQCLERSNFDRENDILITIGDICDGWSEVYECVETLLTIKNRVDIRGNHDDWFNTYIKTGQHPVEWQQGGDSTRNSYLRAAGREYAEAGWGTVAWLNRGDIPDSHKEFFKNQTGYYTMYLDGKMMCFVHGGFDRELPIDSQFWHNLMWNRELWEKAQSCKDDQKLAMADDFDKVFIGHTQVYHNIKNALALPLTCGGITNIDTGAGWNGKLTFMDVRTGMYWQSDWVRDLYKEPGRGEFKHR